jgi:hypothetical protein
VTQRRKICRAHQIDLRVACHLPVVSRWQGCQNVYISKVVEGFDHPGRPDKAATGHDKNDAPLSPC